MKVFIMGCHRSGTSLVTGLLSYCGLYLGNNLLMNAKDNPKGHFEDRRFINLNNALIIRAGGKWHSPPEVIGYNNLKPAMEAWLSTWPKDRIVGWKDPRICLTFRLWKKLIQPEPIKVIVVFRDWNKIARSLKARNNIPIEKGLSIARHYYDEAFSSIRRQPGVQYQIHYMNEFFYDWESELQGVCDFLGLKIPDDKRKIRKFIDPNLWHHRG